MSAAEDVANYLASSEQIPSAVLLGVYEEGERVSRSGGLLVQAMPGVSDDTLKRLEANIAAMGPITDNLRQRSLLEVMQRAADGLDLQVVSQAQAAEFRCRCSRQKAKNSLLYFGMGERQEMMQEGGQEVVCHWCNEHYQITPDEIAALDDDSQPHAQA
jgi:molecular chaperone Hsp33